MTGTLARVPRPTTGTVETYTWKDGRTLTYRVRVRAYGKRWRVDLGTNHQGWNDDRARVELDRIMQQIQRGTWQPPSAIAHALDHHGPSDETVHVTASRWWQRRAGELAAKTRDDYRWRLDHILRRLALDVTGDLDARRVDEFRQQLVSAGLGPRSVNMVLGLLAQVLDDAVEYDLLAANPARGRRRRMKVPKQRRTFLEPDQVVALLDAAGAWERDLPAHQQYGRRAFLTALALGGFRISELIDADRDDLDLIGGRLRVGTKTEAAMRDVELTGFLLSELRAHLAALLGRVRARDTQPLPLFPTRTGGRLNASNVRNRLLTGTVHRANEDRGELLPLPLKLTPHALRRTYASLCFFAGRDPRFVMAQIGHEDARLTLSVYAQVIQRQRVDRALVWELMRFPDERDEAGHAMVQGTAQRAPGESSGRGGMMRR